MQFVINKQLILEASSLDDTYVYHYSNQKFDKIKTRDMLGLPMPAAATKESRYNESVSLLPAQFTKEQVLSFRKAGFVNWGKVSDPLCEYKISVIDNKTAFEGPINITSTEEQFKYDKANWDSSLKKLGLDSSKFSDEKYWEKNQDKFFKFKKDYMKKREQYLKKYTTVSPNDWKLSNPIIKKLIRNQDKNVAYNLKHGNKSQYASYIPHIHTIITKALVPTSVTKII